MGTPLVSVLMAVYNCEKFLSQAIESILNQTFSDFEFIIIDDASTDKSRLLVRRYNDNRIRLIGNDENLRLARTLNRGLQLARGKYVARMDADDLSQPTRLERQVAFMESHPQIGVSGCWLECFGDKRQLWDYTTSPDTIRCELLFSNQLGHATAIMRREWITGKGLYYNPDFRESEDYELWSRCAQHFPLANLPEVLYLYRWHRYQASQARVHEQRYYHYHVCRRQLKRLGLTPSEEEMNIHMQISFPGAEPDKQFLAASRRWLLKIMKANLLLHYYPHGELRKVLEKRWGKICTRAGICAGPLI